MNSRCESKLKAQISIFHHSLRLAVFEPAKVLFNRGPMAHHLFVLIWSLANLGNLGAEMRNTATAWLMTSLNPSPLMVSMIQVANTLPIVLFALPAGAMADIIDRSKIIKVTQIWMMLTVFIMGILYWINHLSGELLIILILLQSMGAALGAPAWDPMMSEAVPRTELRQAVLINAVTSNLIRAVGPVLAGLIIVQLGPSAVFFSSVCTYLFVLIALRYWKTEKRSTQLPPETVVSGMTAGLKYVKHSPILHSLFLRTFWFVFPGSALWALLPLITRSRFSSSPIFYGILLSCTGLGAIAGNVTLKKLRMHLSLEKIVAIDSAIFGIAMMILVYSKRLPLVMLALVMAGAAWLTDISSINSGVQTNIPAWVRARATAVNILINCASIGIGSFLWGLIASIAGTSISLLIAALILLLSSPLYLYFGLRWEEHIDVSQLQRKPRAEPKDIKINQGPVLVTVEYRIDPGKQSDFLHAVHKLRRLRLRDGAIQWGIFRDITDTSRHIEFFLVKSWVDHLRLHARITVADMEIEEFVSSFHIAETAPFVNHFISGFQIRTNPKNKKTKNVA